MQWNRRRQEKSIWHRTGNQLPSGLTPYLDSLAHQAKIGGLMPFEGLRQLALIELTESKYEQLPKDHQALLQQLKGSEKLLLSKASW